eukprot:gb/GFBE01030683.1/.p1 GENE.gb/GFBE01030683.1/~~gb/GFBE01030683.1/.p1  ORF type:complete len:333 (+),score=40.66 gb/GFBE01030683.1/:1-999(+)
MSSRLCSVLLALAAIGAAADDADSAIASAVLSNDECSSSDAGACSLNALQLRGTQEHAVDDDATNTTEHCDATARVCEDYMTYGLTPGECAGDDLCRSLDAGDYGSTKGSAWFCAPKDKACDKYLDLNPNDFEPTEKLAENDTATMNVGLLPGTIMAKGFSSCARHSCHGYVRGNWCQCNSRCRRYGNCCPDYYARCAARHGVSGAGSGGSVGGPVMTLYHTTSPGIANEILRSNFKPGRAGWCGGAIYFINTPVLPRSKYAPGITQSGAIIEARVRMGKIARMGRHCDGMGGRGVHAASSHGYNSIIFNPGDGDEFIVWHSSQIISKRRYK